MKKNLITVCCLVMLSGSLSAQKGEKLKQFGQKVKARAERAGQKVKAGLERAGEKVKEAVGLSKEPYQQTRESGGCNGSMALCSRRYNEVAYAASHNATSKGPSLVNNQDVSLKELMDRGVRVIKIPVHWGQDFGNKQGSAPTVCHGIYRATLYDDYYGTMVGKVGAKLERFFEKVKSALGPLKEVEIPGTDMTIGALPDYVQTYIKGIKPLADMIQNALPLVYGQRDTLPAAQKPFIPCALDPAAQPLRIVLRDIKQFLDTHPRDIFTIKLENTLPIEEIEKDLRALGLHLYTHKQDVTKPWPTLEQMIASNKRLVILGKNETSLINADASYAWQPVKKGQTASKYTSVKSAKKLKEINSMPIDDPNFRNRLQGPKNKLFHLSNLVTVGMGGSKRQAKKVNARSFLRERAKTLGKEAGVIPNFIDTDFTELPNGDVFEVVDELNGVGKYAGESLLEAKQTLQEKRQERKQSGKETRKTKQQKRKAKRSAKR